MQIFEPREDIFMLSDADDIPEPIVVDVQELDIRSGVQKLGEAIQNVIENPDSKQLIDDTIDAMWAIDPDDADNEEHYAVVHDAIGVIHGCGGFEGFATEMVAPGVFVIIPDGIDGGRPHMELKADSSGASVVEITLDDGAYWVPVVLSDDVYEHIKALGKFSDPRRLSKLLNNTGDYDLMKDFAESVVASIEAGNARKDSIDG